MDLEPFHQGVYKFLVLVTAVFTTSVQGATLQPSNIPLKQASFSGNNEIAISQLASSDMPSFSELEVGKIADEKTSDIVQVLDESSGLKIDFVSAEAPIRNTEEVIKKFQEPLATPTPSPTPVPTTLPTPAPVKKPVIASIESKKTAENTADKKEATLAIPSTPPAGGSTLNADLIFNMINEHRAKLGLTAFEKEAKLCSIAESRRPQLHNEIFGSGFVHQGFRQLNLPYWITENMAGYGSEIANFNWWLNSPLHRSAIEGNYKYSCGACDDTSCAQLFTSYVPK